MAGFAPTRGLGPREWAVIRDRGSGAGSARPSAPGDGSVIVPTPPDESGNLAGQSLGADPQLDDVKTALKLGAYDFIGKPLDFEELRVTIQNALEATRLRTEVESSWCLA